MDTMTTTRDTGDARKAMIDSQLRTSGVNEEFVLARMLAVGREDFLPEDKADQAYIDRAIALGPDAHLAAPLFYGKLLLEAAPRPTDTVLLVEGGSGRASEWFRNCARRASGEDPGQASACGPIERPRGGHRSRMGRAGRRR